MRLKLDIQKFAGNTYIFSNGDMVCLLFWSSSVVGNTPAEKAQNNKSNVGVDFYVRSSNAWSPTWGTFTGNININGTVYSFSKYGEAPNDGTWLHLHSASTTIDHNSNGSKTIYVGGVAYAPTGTSWEGKVCSYGTNVSLDTISRMSSITSFTGIADGQSRVNNIEGNFKVGLTRYNQTFTDDLVIEYLDINNTGNWITLKTIQNYENEDIFSFTNAELQTLFSVDTLSNDIKLRAYLKTYAESSLIGDSSKIEFTAKIYDNNPTFSDFTFEDINTTTVALTGNNKINVDGYSNIKITIPVADKAIAKKGASITSYRVVIKDKTTEIAYSSSASVNGTINGTYGDKYEVLAIDSRNNSTSVVKYATAVKEYIPLTRDTNFKAERNNNNVGDECKLTFSGTIWNNSFGSVSNSFTSAKYYIKKTDSSIWIDLGSSMTDITPTITNNTYSFSDWISSDNPDTTWDLESSYDIKVVLEDKLSTIEFQTVLPSAKPTISLSKNGVGIMCDFDDNLGGYLQVNGEVIGQGDTLPINTVVEYAGTTVPTGYELVEDYSTDEIKTNGVWLDGKPIYRKVLHITSGIAVDTDKYINISSLNIDNITDLKGWTHQGGTGFGYISLYFNDGNGRGNKLHTQQGSNTLVYNHHWSADEIYIIIEYTKTTD